MWFNKKQTSKTVDINSLLKSIKSNGTELSIDELLLYQAKSALINLSASKNLHGKMSGNYLARSKGRGMEFDEVRHYQTGDDIRAIDWRVTARTGKTHTKLFREEIERPVLIATDLNSNMLFGTKLLYKSVQAAHIASLVAWHAKARGDRVGGIVFNEQEHQELKPRSRKQGVLHYLHALMQIHTSTHALNDSANIPENFVANCMRIRQIAKPGSLVYLITDGHQLCSEAIRHLSHISRHCELVVCLISDPLENQLPETKEKMNVCITDGKNQQQLTLGDQNIAQSYKSKTHAFNLQKQQLLSKAGARVIQFCAGETIEQQMTSGDNQWTH